MTLNAKSLSVLVGLLISCFCLWLFLRGINWEELSRALHEANYIYVVPAILLSLVGYLIRSARWEILILPIKKVSFMNVLSAMSIGLMANHLLPARAGEIIRCVVLGKTESTRTTGIFATVIMERLLDSVSLIIFATVIIAIISPHAGGQLHTDTQASLNTANDDLHLFDQLKEGIGILGGVCLVIIAFLVFLDIYSRKVIDLTGRTISFMPHAITDKILHLLESLARGMRVLKNARQLLWISFLSFSLWILFTTVMVVLGYSFGIEIPFAAMSFVLVCMSLAIALPQAPAYIGVFHLVVQKSLELFHVSPAAAQSFAIVLWAISVFTSIIIGTLFLWKEGLSFGQIIKARETANQDAVNGK
ncbi:MAG: lysylphosphatidylglycerol synthase transmembrane domain-containing protein [Candidatus Brocadiales bacterium]